MAFLDLAAGLPRNAFERVRSFANGKRRARLIAGIAIVASIVIPAILWSSGTSYSVLFAGLSGEDGGRAIAELQKLNVPYRITDGGRVILVPEADVGFARLQLAARGVPKQDGDQWTLFDNESLGVSPFAEQVHYARAVETALAHTVRDVDGVVSATVKLALSKESDFLTDAPKPSAAVMIRLRPGVQLTTAQIDGVVGLVAAGVPGLSRDNVTLVDQSGKVLNSDGKDGLQQVPRQLEIAQVVAHQYETTITDLLVPVLGRGNFRVSADADIDFSHWQESSVKYGDSHILSEDAASHFRAFNSEQAIGIPGALSNRPPETPTVSVPPAAGQTGAVPAPTADPAGQQIVTEQEPMINAPNSLAPASAAESRGHSSTTGLASINPGAAQRSIALAGSVPSDGLVVATSPSPGNASAASDPSIAIAAAVAGSVPNTAAGGLPDENSPSASAATPLPADLPDRLLHGVIGSIESPGREIVLRLDPPELGNLTVRVLVAGREIATWFATPQAQLQQAIGQAIGQLQTELSNAGYTLSGVWVGADTSSPRDRGASLPLPPRERLAATRVEPQTIPATEIPSSSSGVSIYV